MLSDLSDEVELLKTFEVPSTPLEPGFVRFHGMWLQSRTILSRLCIPPQGREFRCPRFTRVNSRSLEIGRSGPFCVDAKGEIVRKTRKFAASLGSIRVPAGEPSISTVPYANSMRFCCFLQPAVQVVDLADLDATVSHG